MKFLNCSLKMFAMHLVQTFGKEEFHVNMTTRKNHNRFMELVDHGWTYHFMARKRIVFSTQIGRLQHMDKLRGRIERRVAYLLGQPALDLCSGVLNENVIENADETHLAINEDSGLTLGFRGEESVEYINVTSSGEGMTVIVQISAGRDGRMEPSMMV